MIITKSTPLTKEEIEQIRELFDPYIKTVIDVKGKICCAGMDRHYEGEEILLKQNSKQEDIWGGGIDLATQLIDCNSFINIRPRQNNPTNEILDENIRKLYTELTQYFFQEIL